MTSANLSEEPICRSNREARDRLAGIADAFLLHDRDVVRRIDDSVVRSCAGGPVVVRRARGWVPEPLPLPGAAPAPILAVGGHLQATVCVAVGDQAFLSQHCGDLNSEAARRFHGEVIAGLEDFLESEPAVIACDPHPDYFTSWLARELAAVPRARDRSPTPPRPRGRCARRARSLPKSAKRPGDQPDGTGWGPTALVGGETARR
jgi:hydrogenase maturation protein HypF